MSWRDSVWDRPIYFVRSAIMPFFKVPGDGRATAANDRAACLESRGDQGSPLMQDVSARALFLATLAHELRGSLSVIQNALELLEQSPRGGDGAATARDLARRQVQHLTAVVDDLFDISRSAHGKLTLSRGPTRLTDVLTGAVDSIQSLVKERGLTLSISSPSEPIDVAGDQSRLQRILVNLLTNAIKYTDRTGSIWLAAEPVQDMVVFRVRDTGIGISKEMLPHIFDPFVQSIPAKTRCGGGLGIGLTVVQALVESLGGAIAASSDGEGKGSEFVVHLPQAVHGAT
jgi:two-component system CheB/CheR fusion protein